MANILGAAVITGTHRPEPLQKHKGNAALPLSAQYAPDASQALEHLIASPDNAAEDHERPSKRRKTEYGPINLQTSNIFDSSKNIVLANISLLMVSSPYIIPYSNRI